MNRTIRINRMWTVGLAILLTCPLWTRGSLAAEDQEPLKQAVVNSTGREWCQTQIVYAKRYPKDASRFANCPLEGDCDMMTVRDSNIPDAADHPLTVRLKFNIFREDDGSNPAGSVADCEAQIEQVNSDYSPSRFAFEYSYEFIDNSQFRVFNDAEEGAMKSAYADQPDKQINIYVVSIDEGYIGVGTFPWDGAALTNMGGIILDDSYFGSGEKTLTHELGHNLGLWHTHHGVSEVDECSACWELADGSNGDVAGDFCSDTDPTPVNYFCASPGGHDNCSGGLVWGYTDPQNFMGYAPDNCYSEFSSQQWGRMHCWTTSALASQLVLYFAAAPSMGDAPLNVTFNYDTPIEASSYKWYFGDGDSSALANPSHVYDPGIYDVELTVSTPYGDLSTYKDNYVTALADTLDAPDVFVQPNVQDYWEVWATNGVPMTEIILPFNLTNVPSVVAFDSVSFVGTRLAYFETKSLVFDNKFSGQQAWRLIADGGGGSPPLAPGSGPIARIHYRTRTFAWPGQTSVLSLEQLGQWTFTAKTLTGSYIPKFDGATLTIGSPPCNCPAQGELTGDGIVDIIDLNVFISYAFLSGTPLVVDPDCVHVDRGDVNCDGVDDNVDLNVMINHIFFNGPPFCDPCACTSYPGDCP